MEKYLLVNFEKLQPVYCKIYEENPNVRLELSWLDLEQFRRGHVEKDGKTYIKLKQEELDKLKGLYENLI